MANRMYLGKMVDEGPGKKCQNCGAHVTKRFARVFGDDQDIVHSCPDCATYREMKTGADGTGQ